MPKHYNFYKPEEEDSKLGTAGKFLVGLMGGGTVGSSIENIMEEKRDKMIREREKREKREEEATRISDKALLEKRKLEEEREYKRDVLQEKRTFKAEQVKEPKPPKEPAWGRELTAINKDIAAIPPEEMTQEMIDLKIHIKRNYYKSINYEPPYRPPVESETEGKIIPLDENNLPLGKLTLMPPEFVQVYLDFYNNDPVKAKEEAEKNGWIIPEEKPED